MGIIDKIVRFRIFVGTGQSHIEFLKNPLIIGIFLKQWFPSLSLIWLSVLVIVSVIVLAFNGWFDLKFIKLPQKQAEIQTREYNPYFKELEKNLNSSVNKKNHKS